MGCTVRECRKVRVKGTKVEKRTGGIEGLSGGERKTKKIKRVVGSVR